MLVLAYEGALRREELCALRRRDLDLRQGVLRVPAIGASREAARVVPLSAMAVAWCAAHVGEGPVRAGSADPEAPLFRSESPRNRAEPLSVWTWSKVARRVADRAGVAAFTTHTPRHLRLTDLARTGRGAAEIARFAGLSRPHLAHPYVRLAAESPWDADPGLAEARAGQFARTLFRDPP
jgi:integrase